jgi:hypothetical protein
MIRLWYIEAMSWRSVPGYFLAFVAIAGVALAPMMRPAMAMPATTHVSKGEPLAAASMAPSAPHEMQCCPGKPSLADCGKDCPFMALCGALPFQGISQISLVVPLTLVSIIFPGNQSALASVAQAPPRKPPKT